MQNTNKHRVCHAPAEAYPLTSALSIALGSNADCRHRKCLGAAMLFGNAKSKHHTIYGSLLLLVRHRRQSLFDPTDFAWHSWSAILHYVGFVSYRFATVDCPRTFIGAVVMCQSFTFYCATNLTIRSVISKPAMRQQCTTSLYSDRNGRAIGSPVAISETHVSSRQPKIIET